MKVMTVHGLKGLETSIVILCDTTTIPTSSNKIIGDDKEKMFFSAIAADTPEFLQEVKEAEKKIFARIYKTTLRCNDKSLRRADCMRF